MGPHPDPAPAAATTADGADPSPPFRCCSHCAHQNGYVHNRGCEDESCTGYDERTPNA